MARRGLDEEDVSAPTEKLKLGSEVSGVAKSAELHSLSSDLAISFGLGFLSSLMSTSACPVATIDAAGASAPSNCR